MDGFYWTLMNDPGGTESSKPIWTIVRVLKGKVWSEVGWKDASECEILIGPIAEPTGDVLKEAYVVRSSIKGN